MNFLLYFISGIIFISLIIPLIENIVSILSTITEYVTYIYAAKIFKIKQQLNLDQEEQHKNPIGFQTEAIGFYHSQEQTEEEEMK